MRPPHLPTPELPSPAQASPPAKAPPRTLSAPRKTSALRKISALRKTSPLRRTTARRVSRVVAVVFAVLTASAGLGVPARAAEGGVRFGDAGGIHVVKVRQIDDRQYTVRVSTAALGRAVDVRILLPTGYARASTRYPVLYLFHGTSGRASDWVDAGDAEKTTAERPLITVMPDAGFEATAAAGSPTGPIRTPSWGRPSGRPSTSAS